MQNENLSQSVNENPTSAREILRSELARRMAKNPQYSLRAFARSAGVSHTLLSLVLSGKRPMSRKTANRLADTLALDPNQREQFVNAPENTMGHLATARGRKEAQSMRQLSLDQFALISEWYHYAILSLLELPDSKLEPRWISSRLRISQLQAAEAVERLHRLNLLEKGEDGRWRQSGNPIKIDNSVSTPATRKFHEQILSKALESLERDPFETRSFISTTYMLDPAVVPLARERLNELKRALVRELSTLGKPSVVYNLSMQLYPVSTQNTKDDEVGSTPSSS